MRRLRGVGPALLAATVVALGLILAPVGAAPARAADGGLAIATKATYTLVPKAGVVHVTVTVKATNTKPNLVETTPDGRRTTRFFYQGASVYVQREATKIRAFTGATRLAVTAHDPTTTFRVVDIAFKADLFYKRSTAIRLDYDLPGGAPRSASDIRVGSAFATFYVWAFGDGGDVKVVIPSGFTVTATGSTLASASVDGTTVLTATGVTDVTEWYAVIVADRHDALTRERLDLAGGEHLVVRAWPEDTEWQTRVGDLLRRGLPALADLVGLPWPVPGDIEVAEVHTPLLEGYGGVFHVGEDRIEISEELDDLTIIHEASHAWFNSGLIVGRWIDEGFADEYASLVLDGLSTGGQKPESVQPEGPGHVRLNEWVHPGRITDEETNLREQFGYNASWTVIRSLVDEIGEERMRAVLAAASREEIPYVGAPTAERLDRPADWRRFLDLLDGVGRSTRADGLFDRWVVLDSERPFLGARTEARTAYATLVEQGSGWLPGLAVRRPMADWNFDDAGAQITAAGAILATRDRIVALASTVGASVPSALRGAYEGATDLAPVGALADDELATLQAVAATKTGIAQPRDFVTTVGLIGVEPAADLATSISAFGAGDMSGASAAAARADALLAGAPDAGRTTLAIGGVVVAGGALAVGGGGVLVWRRRRRLVDPGGMSGPEATPTPASDPPAAADGPDSYVTLGPPPAEDAGQEPAAPRREEED
jgi:hypothetical protein